MYTNIFSYGEQILPEYHTCNIGLSSSMARPMKLGAEFNNVFLVLVLIVVTNIKAYMCIGRKP